MSYPWFAVVAEQQPDVLKGADHVKRWIAAMAARPAVQQGMAVGAANP